MNTIKNLGFAIVFGVLPQAECTNYTTADEISLNRALLIALENNPSLRIKRIAPLREQFNEDIEASLFDPRLSSRVSIHEDMDKNTSNEERSALDLSLGTGLSQNMQGGRSINLDLDLKRDESTSSSKDNLSYQQQVGADLRFTQALGRGRGTDFTMAAIKKARLSTRISEQSLKRYIETIIFRVSNAYWSLYLEQKKLRVYQESFKMALDHENEVSIFISSGKLAEIELATVKAEVSSRRERLIKAKGSIDKKRLELIQILNYKGLSPDAWELDLLPSDRPQQRYPKLQPVLTYITTALTQRPEVLEAELKIQRQDLELIRTRNGLLPKLDFFVSLGGTHYANSFATIDNNDSFDKQVSIGVDMSLDVFNRRAIASQGKATLDRETQDLAYKNLLQTIELEVRQAYIDCQTNLENISAVRQTSELRKQALKTENIKFELGKSTNQNIADAQRDLLSSQINHTQAIIDYVRSRLRLHYLDGTLVEKSHLTINH